MSKRLTSVYDLKWEPRALIEASAGTGKTFTITALFVRLLIEKGLDISEILVMTFTRKATSELGGRIFKRLRDCLRVLENGIDNNDDAFLIEFSERVDNKAEAMERLRSAILNFDESQIMTIHGFCQKVLKEESLAAGTLFEMDVIQHDELLEQAAEDFWRLFMDRYDCSDAGRYYINKLLKLADSPAELQKLISPLIKKPYAVVEGEGMDDPVEYLEDVQKLRMELKETWTACYQEIKNEMLSTDLKHYTAKNVESRLNNMDHFLNDDRFNSDSFDQFIYFTSTHQLDPVNLKKGKSRVPEHHFFELCDQYFDLISDIDKVQTTIIREAFEEILNLRNKLLNISGTVTYDDLLITVQDSLTSPGRGRELAGQLMNKYPFALVDEFQDTDPVQYEILDSIYPETGEHSGLFMIGDPKQAIYGFRGADVYTYFKARDSISGSVYTLQENYRSTPLLIEAVNTMFSGEHQPFIEDHIDFFDSESGNPVIADEFLIDEKPGSYFKVTARRGVEKNKDELKEFAFNQTVFEIARLLEKSKAGEITIEGKNLRGGDIAVLVANHTDAAEIKRMLKSVGIDAATQSRQVVFDTFEAHRMELLMAAVLDPFHRTKVNNVLTSGFFGLDLSALYELKEDADKRDQLIETLQQFNEVWYRDGFYPMFRSVLLYKKNLSKLAEHSDAERILTNLLQLGDICSKAEEKGRLSPGELYSWFKKEKADPDQDEERTLLLESDQNLVKISTIHSSKGLQYPIVFCPGLWESKYQENRLVEYHSGKGGGLVISIDQHNSDSRNNAELQSRIESVAEDVRKAYVAMTRAKYACHIIWTGHSDAPLSGIGSLLVGRKKLKEFIENNDRLKEDKGIPDTFFLELFNDISKKSSGIVDYEVLDEADRRSEPVFWTENRIEEMKYRPYNGRSELPVRNRLESFSSLIHHQADPRQPDYDQVMDRYLGLFGRPETGDHKADIFSFPRGATAGNGCSQTV
jgi:exodeoxyribonuclease V beta subunit